MSWDFGWASDVSNAQLFCAVVAGAWGALSRKSGLGPRRIVLFSGSARGKDP